MAKISNIRGPYPQRVRGEIKKWQVRYDRDGVSRVSVRNRKEKAEALIEELHRESLDGGGQMSDHLLLPEHEPFDGTADWWKRAFASTLLAAHRAATVRDAQALDTVKKYVGVLKDASLAWKDHSDYAQMEAAYEVLVEYMEQTGHVQRREGDAKLHVKTPELAAALRSVGGPDAAILDTGDALPDQGRPAGGGTN